MRHLTFVSYSHTDEVWCQRLLIHLKPYTRDNPVILWSDQRIRAGERWRQEIAAAIEQSQAAVLLVSPDFLASDFIASEELPPLLQAAEKDGLTILWVPVSFSAYRKTPIAEYQAAWEPARPLEVLSKAEQDRALVGVCQQLEMATWSLTVELTQPAATSGSRTGHQLSIRGRVHFRPRGISSPESAGSSVRAALTREGVQLIPFVYSGPDGWWPQGALRVEDDVSFAGTVSVGDSQGQGVGSDFEVVVCVVAQGAVTWGKPTRELPVARIESRRVMVRRE